MTTIYTATASDIDYTPSGITATPTERCAVFVPPNAPPPGERSCHVYIANPGFTGGSVLTSIDPTLTLMYRRLQRGSVVVTATVTQVKAPSQGGPAGMGTWDSHLASGTNLEHWNDPAFSNCIKSGGHLVGWLKTVGVDTYGIDPNKITMEGRSGASPPVLWCGLGADFNSFSDPGQFRAGISTRVAGIIPIQLAAWWRAFKATSPGIVAMPWAPKSSNPLNQSASSWLDTFPSYSTLFSPLRFAFDDDTYTNIQLRNAQMPVFIPLAKIYNGIESQFDPDVAYATDANGEPLLNDVLTDQHDGWHGVMLWRRLVGLAPDFHGKWSRAVQEAPHRFHTANGLYTTEPFSRLVPDFSGAMELAADWIDEIHGDKPLDEPVSEKIIANVEAALHVIVAGPDYYRTPSRIVRGIDEIQSHKGSDLLISIVPQTSEWMPRGEESNNTVSSRMRIEIVFLLRGRDGERAGQAVHRTVRDIARALLLDPQRTGLTTSTTIVGIEYLHSDLSSSGLEGAAMEVEFEYRTPFQDLNFSV